MIEKRIFDFEKLETRAADDGSKRIVGYAAVFNRRSLDLGGFVEVIAPGAFAQSLRSRPDVRATIDHQGGLNMLGRTTNGTLSLTEDENGLLVEIVPPDTTAGRDALHLVERGDISQMSFMFRVGADGQTWERMDDGVQLRTLTAVDINDGDVSIVTYPAYPQTSVEARDMAKSLDSGQAAADKQNEDAERQRAQARRAARQRKIKLLRGVS